jgi:hypothetical protein
MDVPGMSADALDPTLWAPDAAAPRRLYLDASGEVWVLLDAEDYDWAVQWVWTITRNSTGLKIYATRNTRHPNSRRQIKLYLHKEILKRFAMQPSPKHHICDHKNGDSTDCRRANLRWATPKENRANYYGDYARQERLFEGDQ